MFTKILIANRGAIATRIIRTLKAMQIKTIAVYAECDADSLHVQQADEAYSLGIGAASDTYLDQAKLFEVARKSGAEAVHPGYGFLSENAQFVEACEENNLIFIGPTPQQIREFGLKHEARALAVRAKVPLLPGTELLADIDEATREARRIGYPVMLKTTAGGGGIGMQLCHSENELVRAFDSIKRLGANNFSDDGVFLEKFIAQARHIEVQMFGDGQGGALAIGERDCSSQRRNQKVVEECPAPNLPTEIAKQLHETAESLFRHAHYRGAGTVEFIVDAATNNFYFLEVNTRLQVEHGVTEMVYNIDLVEWMVKLAAHELSNIENFRQQLTPSGHAIQVRVYAEDPYKNFQPSADKLTQVSFPTGDGIRIDHWIEAGIDIPPFFDPMLAKVIVHADNRTDALTRLSQTLNDIQIYGCVTNLNYLSALAIDSTVEQGKVTTRYLDNFHFYPTRIDVLQGGTQTTIQDVPGRRGYWDVGVPPSGPFDSRSFRLANRLLNNDTHSAGLEITVQGPQLLFSTDTTIAITGADIQAELDDTAIPMWQAVTVKTGQKLTLGRIQGTGARAYLAVKGGIDCPEYLGSRSTFTLGQFGGHNGRALRTGDVLSLHPSLCNHPVGITPSPETLYSELASKGQAETWVLRVIYGPHGAPDFFTEADITTFLAHEWEIHYNSSRTGVRLIGPKPDWARKDGGEAGLHPSNIHDNAYAFGSIDFTGDMPVILGPDGPSLGGFVCPATVITADLWKLGQLKAGDKIRFHPVSIKEAVQLEAAQHKAIEQLTPIISTYSTADVISPIVARLSADRVGDEVIYRAAGDHFLLVEYGDKVLDIRLRFRAHALMQWLQKNSLQGMAELTPGIRSLQIHYDSQQLSLDDLLTHLQAGELALAEQLTELSVPSRIVHIPLSWDDEACRLAIEKYDQSVRKNAPWSPSNLEFIRRINGLDSIDDVKSIVFDASYLVMGLGDVYLGAPVATPVDPRHRLVTTKYNPARTWTAENSVGIGGSYMCVYGMEGPGGYQFVGRTLQMWNRFKQTNEFSQPWLLRFFDQIRFYEVTHDELTQIRKDFPQGRYPLRIEETSFSLSDYETLLSDNESSTQQFRTQRQQAFSDELACWHRDGQFNYTTEEAITPLTEADWPETSIVIDSPVSGSVWQSSVSIGDTVAVGQELLVLESMKMEIPIYAPSAGTVTHVLVSSGQQMHAGQALIVMEESA